MNTRKLTLSFLGLVTLLAAAPATAADVDDLDVKIYPGQMCIANSGVSGVTSWRGRAFSDRADIDIWAACPVIRDVVGAGGRIVSAWVKVVDQHYSDDFQCGMWTQNSDSYDGWSGFAQTRYSAGSGNAVQTLNFSSLNAFSTSAFYVFECLIPNVYSGNNSQLVAYSVTED